MPLSVDYQGKTVVRKDFYLILRTNGFSRMTIMRKKNLSIRYKHNIQFSFSRIPPKMKIIGNHICTG